MNLYSYNQLAFKIKNQVTEQRIFHALTGNCDCIYRFMQTE